MKDKWIKVIERLPDSEGHYRTNRGVRYFKKHWIYNFDFIDREVTEWKPLITKIF